MESAWRLPVSTAQSGYGMPPQERRCSLSQISLAILGRLPLARMGRTSSRPAKLGRSSSGVPCPEGARLATASFDLTAKVWDASNGELLLTLSGHTNGLRGVAFSPDGSLLLT